MKDPERRLSPSLVDALTRSVRPKDSAECPDADTLADWADGTLRGHARAAVLEHLSVCPVCAPFAAQLVDLYAPVRALHGNWYGFRGALLLALGLLARDETLLHAYAEHRKRCERCRRKAMWLLSLRRVGTNVFGQPYAPLRAAVVCATLVLVIFRPLGQWRHEVPNGSGQSALRVIGPADTTTKVPLQTRSKGGPNRSSSPPGSRATANESGVDEPRMHRLLDPSSAAEVDSAIKFWEDELGRNRHRSTALAALIELYSQKARYANSPEERDAALDRRKGCAAQLAAVVNPGHPPTGAGIEGAENADPRKGPEH